MPRSPHVSELCCPVQDALVWQALVDSRGLQVAGRVFRRCAQRRLRRPADRALYAQAALQMVVRTLSAPHLPEDE